MSDYRIFLIKTGPGTSHIKATHYFWIQVILIVLYLTVTVRSCGSWIYNYPSHQSLSPLRL